MQPHFKKYILENADTKSVQEIAAHLNLSEKSVADFLKKEKVRSPGGRGGNTPADALSKNPASAAQPAAAPQRRRDLSSDPRGGGPAPAPGFDFRQT
ncbi:MAG TPA: hypothetical protein VL404_04650, partial [Candidatus Eisenbacteria bacterium]|nr:hypothetical protein [Candidatus Eisenbacteria bacterium]